MSVLFPKWMNTLPTVGAIGTIGGLTAIVGAFWYWATPSYWNVGYMPVQPGGGFSHQIHAGKLGMDCRYCHTKIEKSSEANIPNVATCYGCHAAEPAPRLAALTLNETHKQRTDFIRTAYKANESVEWHRVHKLPDYVRNFPHQAHIHAGVSCFSCHGQMTALPVVYQSKPLHMGWCLECHRSGTYELVPPEKVTQLQWVEKELADRAAQPGKDAPEIQAQIDAMKLNPPTNCGACHY